MFYFFYVIFIVLLVLGNIQPHKNYNYIIIPVSKQPSRTNYITLPYKKPLAQIDSADRIDIENYEEQTEMPNIDYFDYMKDRDASDHEDLSLNREEFLKYLVKANRQPKKHKKYDMTGILRDDELPTDDYESLYGDNKIVGGMEVDINLYPYHAAYGSNCGGAIIDAKWVLTAGHCGVKEYVRVGSKYMNQGTKVAVKAHYIHPQWDARKKQHPFDFDFQLLELAQSLEIGDNIQPVKIARIEDMVIGKVITVTGWGNTREDGPYSYILRAVRVPIISKENCQHVPFPYFRGALTPRMFCAGFSEGKKDACQGDSGGPAVAYGRLLGMVSFGYGCATPGSYGVYSKVARVRPWIEETTGLKLD